MDCVLFDICALAIECFLQNMDILYDHFLTLHLATFVSCFRVWAFHLGLPRGSFRGPRCSAQEMHSFCCLVQNDLDNSLFFLQNLDALHDHLSTLYPGMRAPCFRVTERTDGALVLHYTSHRSGLEHVIIGMVRTVARRLHNKRVQVSDVTGSRDHVIRPGGAS